MSEEKFKYGQDNTYEFYFQSIINLAHKLGFEIKSYSPYKQYQNLQTLLIFNPSLSKSETAFIHISGLHGVEGAAGAEVQLEILEKYGNSILESSIGFLMIFSLNPYGFHFIRRASIENIDLNRNTGEGIAPVTLTQLHRLLRPLWKSHNLINHSQGLLQSIVLSTLKGFPMFMRYFAEGQNCEPQGVFYSGTQTALEIKELYKQIIPLLKNTKRLNILDCHTGLGNLYGEILFIECGDLEKAKQIFSVEIVVPGAKQNSYRGEGLLADRFKLLFPNIELNYFVQEFGIKSTAHSFFSLLFENQYHWNYFGKVSDKTYLLHPVKKLFFKTYFSTQPKWKAWLKETGLKRFSEFFESTR